MAAALEDVGITGGDYASALALKCARHNGSSATSRAGFDNVVNKVDQLVGESNCDLLAHPITVADWEHICWLLLFAHCVRLPRRRCAS